MGTATSTWPRRAGTQLGSSTNAILNDSDAVWSSPFAT